MKYYYTTKDKGWPVLPISYMIVKDHEGEISGTSRINGHNFAISLPLRRKTKENAISKEVPIWIE
jgi:nitrogen-specific signal transduction histidine kinase